MNGTRPSDAAARGAAPVEPVSAGSCGDRAAARRGHRARAHDGGDGDRDGRRRDRGRTDGSRRGSRRRTCRCARTCTCASRGSSRRGPACGCTAGSRSSPLARPPAATRPRWRSSATSGSSPRWTGCCSRTCRRSPWAATRAPGSGGTRGSAARRSTRPASLRRRGSPTPVSRAVEDRLPGLLLVVVTSEIDPRGPGGRRRPHARADDRQPSRR